MLWIGDHHGGLLDEPGLDVAGTVAMSLPNVARNRGALRRARLDLGMGTSVDSEAWRNQCRPDHRLRGPAFRALRYDVRDIFGMPQLDIDRPLTASQIDDYARAHLDAQVPADPTIFQTPGHIIATATGWDNAILLAEATASEVERRGLSEPTATDPHERRRSLFATLCVRPSDLDPAMIRYLVDRYVRLPVDGFWVWAVGFDPSATQAERVLHLVLALQENSGLPACPGGLGHLWQAALARGVAATIAGPDRGAIRFDPDEAPSPPRDPDEPDPGREMHTYLGSVLGCFPIDQRGREIRAEAFRRTPCPCGHHLPDVPPRGRREISGHNQFWRLAEARSACVGTAIEASTRLAVRLPGAREERLAVGLGPLRTGWHRAVQPWDSARVGWGAADGRAA